MRSVYVMQECRRKPESRIKMEFRNSRMTIGYAIRKACLAIEASLPLSDDHPENLDVGKALLNLGEKILVRHIVDGE